MRELRVRQARAAAARTDAELLPYIGPPFALGFSELLGVAPDAPIVAACIDGYRERYATASLTETTVPPGIPEALDALQRPPARGRHLQAARASPSRCSTAMGLREHFEVVAGPELERTRREQDRDARPRAASSSARRAR